MKNLFQSQDKNQSHHPLAERLRPDCYHDIIGQTHLLKPSGPIGRMHHSKHIMSLILWGPPGSGKTTIARSLANSSKMRFINISAIHSSIAELKKIFQTAEKDLSFDQKTILFVDEIHRFNRTQQDAFLPYVETGKITLIGATTENPSFEINSALLSRMQVFQLYALSKEELEKLIDKAERYTQKKLPLDRQAKSLLIDLANGDGRYLLNLIESILTQIKVETPLSIDKLKAFLQKRAPQYDKNRDGHYHFISALHKSIRGSDPDAALYWFSRMLIAGEDPLYLARRLIRIASEDIGLADSSALLLTHSAKQTYQFLGSPEGELALAHAVIYLATAPKSNAAYSAFKQALKTAQETSDQLPPKHIINASTKLMETFGYGKGYRYDHDEDASFSGQNYFPEKMKRHVFYDPKGNGKENIIKQRLEAWEKIRKQSKSK